MGSVAIRQVKSWSALCVGSAISYLRHGSAKVSAGSQNFELVGVVPVKKGDRNTHRTAPIRRNVLDLSNIDGVVV